MNDSNLICKCTICGENWSNSGNYKYRLIPSGKMPLKSLKLYRKLKKNEITPVAQWKSNSSFDKYFQNKAVPKNTIEVTCGKCKSILRHSLPKPLSKATTTGFGSAKKKAKTKAPQDINAGLIIPPSLTLTTQSPSINSTASSKLFVSSFQGVQKRKSESWIDQSKKQKKHEVSQKSKEMNELRKSLFKSKNFASGSNRSLDNFLS